MNATIYFIPRTSGPLLQKDHPTLKPKNEVKFDRTYLTPTSLENLVIVTYKGG